MKERTQVIRSHLDGTVSWAQARLTDGFLETVNGAFPAAKRKAQGYRRIGIIRAVIFPIAGKLSLSRIQPSLTNGRMIRA